MPKPATDSDISVILFNASTIMVGICLTAIGILSLDDKEQRIVSIGDILITMDTLLFLLAGILAYVSLRNRQKQRNYRLEITAEVLFVVAMCLTVVISLLLVFLLF
jgi:hypothetical protein